MKYFWTEVIESFLTQGLKSVNFKILSSWNSNTHINPSSTETVVWCLTFNTLPMTEII